MNTLTEPSFGSSEHAASAPSIDGLPKSLGMKFVAGQTFEATYPFVHTTYQEFDEEGPYEARSWRPGVEYVESGPEDTEAIAHGEGKMLLEVIDCHKPGRYPTRVFFIRRWRSPEGVVFGKAALRVTTSHAFTRLTKGYRHQYRMELPK